MNFHRFISRLKYRIGWLVILSLLFGIGTLKMLSLTLNTESYPIMNEKDEGSLLNITNFQFLSIPRETCSLKKFKSDPNKSIISFVHSSRKNFLSRQIVRQTYGSLNKYKNWYIPVVFLLGLGSSTEDVIIQKQLETEVATHGDILMGNFEDTYRNLSYKHLMGYKWVIEYCPWANYYIKSDDDTLIDIFHILLFLESQDEIVRRKKWKYYYCFVLSGGLPIRENANDSSSLQVFKLSLAEYSEEVFPNYCGFSVYLTTIETIQRIYSAVKSAKFLWIDDVFVTGILRASVNQHIGIGEQDDTINLIPANVFDFGYDERNINYELDKSNTTWLAIIIESRSADITCKLWRKIEKIHGIQNTLNGACELL